MPRSENLVSPGNVIPVMRCILVPKGQSENSPAFQRRVIVGGGTSPTGTAEFHFHKYRSSYSMRCFFSNTKNSS